MAGWEMVRLGEVLTHRKEFIQIDDLETYKRCRVQLHAKGIVLRDIVDGTLIKTKNSKFAERANSWLPKSTRKLGASGLFPTNWKALSLAATISCFK